MNEAVVSVPEIAPLLQPDQNPWYCLATIYGDAPEFRIKNRDAWNAWYSQNLDRTGREKQRKLKLSGAWEKRSNSELLDEIREIYKCRIPSDFLGSREPPGYDQPIEFSSIEFNNGIFLAGYLFPVQIMIMNCKFDKEIMIANAIFMNSFGVERSIVPYIHLYESNFLSDIHFDGNIIDLFSSGKNSIFGDFYFLRNNIRDIMDVQSNIFMKNFFIFTKNIINKADYSGTVFWGFAQFQNSIIGESVFWNCEFKSKTSFHGTIFLRRPPDFRSAKLHEATVWGDTSWPPIPQDGREVLQHVYAYERLKQEMDRLKKIEDEQFFYRKELSCRRSMLSKWSIDWISSSLYELLSEYGYSISRPAVSIVGLLFAISDCIWLSENYISRPVNWFRALGMSFSNVFSFLQIARDLKIEEPNSLTIALSAIESVAGILLFFLLGLALRNRFRLR